MDTPQSARILLSVGTALANRLAKMLSPVMVILMRVAGMLLVFLFALPRGVLADLLHFDRNL